MSQGPKGEASVAGRVKYCLQPTPLPGALGSPLIVSVCFASMHRHPRAADTLPNRPLEGRVIKHLCGVTL
jgi:hypothetical protein